MTGFGEANQTIENFTISVEVKSLNSKFADISLRLPSKLNSKEIELRKLVSDTLERGKISVIVEVASESSEDSLLDKEQFQKYYTAYKSLANGVKANDNELFKLALHSPGVLMSANSLEIPDEVLSAIPDVINKAMAACYTFRSQEGKELERKLTDYIKSIKFNLDEIEKLDAFRTERVSERLKTSLNNLELDVEIDRNRFEQELIYYIEKFDISEEKVRLNNHLNYFLSILDLNESAGKKLGFVSQEIGREINTIGSKANDSSIQKHVVAMKEELEKIKEQALNIL